MHRNLDSLDRALPEERWAELATREKVLDAGEMGTDEQWDREEDDGFQL